MRASLAALCKDVLAHQAWRAGGREGGKEEGVGICVHGAQSHSSDSFGNLLASLPPSLSPCLPPSLPSTGCGTITSSPPRTTTFSFTLSRLEASTRKSSSFSISSAQDLKEGGREGGREGGSFGIGSCQAREEEVREGGREGGREETLD